ncbi:MAG: hypothetical protein H6561_16475 [Lewinellaceae bacterium]|nr:hypothetical protein [Lewinellaceae bacterium]
MEPVMLLLPNQTFFNLLRLLIDKGIIPSILFHSKFKYFRLINLPMVSGITLIKLLFDKKIFSSSSKSPISIGSPPFKLCPGRIISITQPPSFVVIPNHSLIGSLKSQGILQFGPSVAWYKATNARESRERQETSTRS